MLRGPKGEKFYSPDTRGGDIPELKEDSVSYKVGNGVVVLKRGKIWEAKSDAIALGTSTELDIHTGVIGHEIRQKGGIAVEYLVQKPLKVAKVQGLTIRPHYPDGRVSLGDVFSYDLKFGGQKSNLNTDRLIIAATMDWDDNGELVWDVGGATKNALKKAEELNLDSIAFHPFGTTPSGFWPPEEKNRVPGGKGGLKNCVPPMIEEFKKALMRGDSRIENIELFFLGEKAFQTARGIGDSMLKE